MQFGTKEVQENLLGDLVFHENQYSDSHASLTGINEFLSILSTFIVRYWQNLVKEICT
jgi:hypothetical protein